MVELPSDALSRIVRPLGRALMVPLGVLVLRCLIQSNAKVSKPRDGPPLDRSRH